MNNPKEKAIELVNKFKYRVNPYIGSSMLSNTHDDQAILYQSKICAEIVVDEIIASHSMYTGNLNPKWKYWNDVKYEIKELT